MKRFRDFRPKCSVKAFLLFNRADAKANALMMEPPPPKPIIDMEPHMENGKLPYAAARDNYQQVHKVHLLLH